MILMKQRRWLDVTQKHLLRYFSYICNFLANLFQDAELIDIISGYREVLCNILLYFYGFILHRRHRQVNGQIHV